MSKVFVTDCNSRKALCVARSLGKQGYEVMVGCDDKINMSRFSKYCSGFQYLPNPITNEKEYLNKVIKIVIENNVDVLIPMEDETVELVIKNKQMFNGVKTLLPNLETFMIARDKGETIKKAIELGLSCPQTYFVRYIEELDKLKNEIIYPVIIKPRISSGSRGLIHVDNKDELIKKYKEIHDNYPFPLIQQYVSGDYSK